MNGLLVSCISEVCMQVRMDPRFPTLCIGYTGTVLFYVSYPAGILCVGHVPPKGLVNIKSAVIFIRSIPCSYQII